MIHACISESEGPSAEAGEEVGLDEASDIIWLKVFDAPLVHHARRDMPGLDKVAQPLRAIWVDLVVEVHRSPRSREARDAWPASRARPQAPAASERARSRSTGDRGAGNRTAPRASPGHRKGARRRS